ncbi:head GIN domain-containing protein [Algibacter miyuki]|uniref:Head GIN domain-containing protein n=1 Tax=Algibacter miyuki TaxID=1306933 RepID=A0ABV5GVP3_9FLAO|nr:head GIN domain-containing protein [Algibacter miyuki]MDN3664963.1 head GIN domain-containing protein [Algibacter miyuki]
MKTIVKILVLFISTSIFANNTIEKEIGEFKTLKVYDLITVELVKSDTNKVVITGENAENVVIVNKNGLLKVKMNLNEIFDGNKIKVKLYYTAVDLIDANEGSKIFSKDVIKQFEIDLRAQEGGSIDVPLEVSFTNIKATTGSVIKTTGTSTNQKITIYTGGIYKAETLKTTKTEVAIKAAGEAHITASEEADVNIRAGGDVYIYGKPKNVTENTAFGGRINYVD